MTSSSPTTIKDIADALGMAHTTVSRALNNHSKIKAETKQRVREMATQLNYVANAGARHMRSGSSKQIGFIVPDVQNEFFNAVARSLAEQCSRLGYQLSLGISEDDPEQEQKYVQLLRENRAEGLIIAPCGNSLPHTRTLLSQIPHVQVLRYDPSLGGLAVTADDAEATKQAVKHLLSQGHRHIAYVGTPLSLSTAKARMRGYQQALKEHSIEPNHMLSRFGPTIPAFGKAAARSLLESDHRITAFMVASTRQVVGVLQALKAANLRIPEDVSVVSYGDTEWFDLATPSISAVALPVAEMSDRATEVLFAELHNQHQTVDKARRPSEQVFQSKLIIRESSGPVRTAS